MAAVGKDCNIELRTLRLMKSQDPAPISGAAEHQARCDRWSAKPWDFPEKTALHRRFSTSDGLKARNEEQDRS
jgi:hypothetical protein